MTSITFAASDLQPRAHDAARSTRRAVAATVPAAPSRLRAVWQVLIHASRFVGDARVAWATGGTVVTSIAPPATPKPKV